MEAALKHPRGITPGGWITKEHYSYRDQLLADLGFDSYADYLKSDLWQEIRARVLDGRECECCYGRATQVHHEQYTKDNLAGDSDWHLFGLCRDCHKAIEYSKKGRKLDPTQVAYKLAKLRHDKRRKAHKRQNGAQGRAPTAAPRVRNKDRATNGSNR